MCHHRQTVFKRLPPTPRARFKLLARSHEDPAEEALPTTARLHRMLDRNTIRQTPRLCSPFYGPIQVYISNA